MGGLDPDVVVSQKKVCRYSYFEAGIESVDHASNGEHCKYILVRKHLQNNLHPPAETVLRTL